MAAVRLSSNLNKYRSDSRFNSKISNYKVSVCFGLHKGFGIEGSIGSVYKIDASYLSPNVNMATTL